MTEGSDIHRGRHARRVALVAGVFMACAKAPSPPSVIPPTPSVAVSSLPLGWPYWQAPLVALPLNAERAHDEEGDPAAEWLEADTVWREDSRVLVAKLRTQWLAVHETGRFETEIGAFYEERSRRGAPLLITIDALFAMAHVALAVALTDVEIHVDRVELLAMLHRLDARLSAEVGRARPDLLAGYRVARATVAIALALAEPSSEVPADLLEIVSLEVARIRAHAGLAPSPLFGVRIDYGSMSVRGGLASPEDSQAGVFEAAEWLAHAPFLIEGRGESDGAAVDVGTARTHTRAALLLSRLLVPEGDPIAMGAFARLDRLALFVLGGADDLTPLDLAQLARANDVDPRGGGDIVNTAKVDHLRHAASRAPALFDGSGSVRTAGDGSADLWRPARSMRLVPLRGTPDGRLLERVVFPFVGALSAGDAGSATLPSVRTMPSSLDVGAWLGSSAASQALTARGDPLYAGFDRALSSPASRSEISSHGSLFNSGLDAIATWLHPSSAENEGPPPAFAAHERRKLDAALVAWTFLRHDALAFGSARVLSPNAEPSTAAPVSGSRPTPVFVEPHPEALASLLGTIRQARRGLVEIGALANDAPSVALLDETERILSLALEGSVRAAGGAPAFGAIEPALAELPARMAAVERRAGPAATPLVIDVHMDVGSGRVLEEATGPLDELFVRMVDPVRHQWIVAVGAVIPHFEFEGKDGTRKGDAAWMGQLRGGGAPPRDAFTDADLVAPE